MLSTAPAIQAYVPRSSSRLSSPATQSPNPAYSPRPTPTSSLRNEVDMVKTAKASASAILDLLNGLPFPLSPILPPKFLPAARKSSPTTTEMSKFPTFARKRSSEESPKGIGLGIIAHSPTKKARTTPSPTDSSHATGPASHSPDLARVTSGSRATTPELRGSVSGSPVPGSGPGSASMRRELGRSSLRNEIARDDSKGSGTWTRARFRDVKQSCTTRAVTLKRYGDAYQHLPTCKEHLRARLPQDNLLGLLSHTDSVCMWLFSYFCDEQLSGVISTKSYHQLNAFLVFVVKGWEAEARRTDTTPVEQQGARGMVGFMYLVDAVISYYLSTDSLKQLAKRSKDISAASSAHGPSPPSSSSSPPGPSPGSSGTASELADILPLITSSSTSSNRATNALQTSRHHLSLRHLRVTFPDTWECAINSELADDLLPAPGDILGCARALDIDRPETFAWPIELGMLNAGAHVAVFGRSLVREFAVAARKHWDLVLPDDAS